MCRLVIQDVNIFAFAGGGIEGVRKSLNFLKRLVEEAWVWKSQTTQLQAVGRGCHFVVNWY